MLEAIDKIFKENESPKIQYTPNYNFKKTKHKNYSLKLVKR